MSAVRFTQLLGKRGFQEVPGESEQMTHLHQQEVGTTTKDLLNLNPPLYHRRIRWTHVDNDSQLPHFGAYLGPFSLELGATRA